MASLATVHPGDTLGSLCARHRLTREAFFQLNPQKNVLRTQAGVLTTDLTEGEAVRVGAGAEPTFARVENPAQFIAAQECARDRKVPYLEDGVLYCASVEQDEEGRYLYFADTDEFVMLDAPSEHRWKAMQQCLVGNGYFKIDDNGAMSCLKTAIVDGAFGAYLGVDAGIPLAKPGEMLELTDAPDTSVPPTSVATGTQPPTSLPTSSPPPDKTTREDASSDTPGWAYGAAAFGLLGVITLWFL